MAGLSAATDRLRREQGNQQPLATRPARQECEAAAARETRSHGRYEPALVARRAVHLFPREGQRQRGDAGLACRRERCCGEGARGRDRAAGRHQCIQAGARWQAHPVGDRCAGELHGLRLRGEGAERQADEQGQRPRLRQALHPALGYLGRRQAFAAFHRRHRRERHTCENFRSAPAQPRDRRRRPIEALRRRRRVLVFTRRQDRVLRRAHRGQERAVVDELRYLLGACGRLGRAEEPHCGEFRLGRALRCHRTRWQDLVLRCDEAPDFRGRSLRHHGARSCHRQNA